MRSSEESPFVSIILPVRNEGRYLRRTMESVLCQDYPLENMEILVAEGMSTDDTRAILVEFQAKGKNLLIFDNPGRIVPTGMNIAMLHARGEILIRVDGHCEIAPDFVQRCVFYLQNDLADGVGGPMDTVGETTSAMLIAIAMSTPFGVGNSAFRTISGKTMPVDTVPFPAYKRSVIEHAGGYDEELVRDQDDEYNYRLREMGYRILMAADIHSRYYSRSTLRSLWRQYFQYGYWKVRVLQKHPRQMRLRQFVPGFFVASLLLSIINAGLHANGWIMLGLLAGSYLLANLGASAYTAYRHGWKYFLGLPWVFAILHVSYGVGFLVGLVRFATRWGDTKGQTPNGEARKNSHDE